MVEKIEAEQFFAKVGWEGGIGGAMEYGVKAREYDLPSEFAEKWDSVAELFWELLEEYEELADELNIEEV